MALVGIVLLMVGWGVWWVGRRGFSVGSHPYCRTCGFDLYGLPSQRERCPECGTNILVDSAIRVGFHQKVLAIMVLGAAISLIGAGLAAGGIASWWPTFDGSRYKPLVWLEKDLDASDPILRRRACAEIEQRITSGVLSSQEMGQVTALIIQWQGDAAVPWDPRWGDLVQASRAVPRASVTGTGRLSDALWERYLSQTMQIEARVRPRIRLDDPIPIGVSCRMRAGSKYTEQLHIALQPQVEASLGKYSGTLQSQCLVLDVVPVPLEWVMLWFPTEGQKDVPLEIAPGRQTLSLKVTLTAGSDGAKGARMTTFSLPFELLAKSESSVMQGHSLPGGILVAPEWDRAIRLRGPFVERGALLLDRAGTARLFVGGPPMCAAFRAVLRQNDREWRLARFMVREDDAALIPLSLPPTMPESAPQDGPAQIVCVPEPELAAATVDIMEVWGEPIIRDIVIKLDAAGHTENH